MASPTPASGATEPVDRARLARVRDEVGEHTLRRFISVYLDLLRLRLRRIADPLEGDRADGVRAAFDLRVASEMLGAFRLAEMVAEIERSFREGKAPSARQTALLQTEADSVAAALSSVIGTGENSGG